MVVGFILWLASRAYLRKIDGEEAAREAAPALCDDTPRSDRLI